MVALDVAENTFTTSCCVVTRLPDPCVVVWTDPMPTDNVDEALSVLASVIAFLRDWRVSVTNGARSKVSAIGWTEEA